MQHFRFITLKSLLLFLVISFFSFMSCEINDDGATIDNSNKLIEPRDVSIWQSSVFEEHNEYILWVFENYEDSLIYYASRDNDLDFLEFASRRSHEFNDVQPDYSDLIENGDIIITHPYYTTSAGFTYQDIYQNWSINEKNAIKSVLDSIYAYVAVASPVSESVILQLINNGKARVNNLNSTNENVLMNCLIQTAYSVALMYDLEDTYGDPPGPQGFFINPCLLAGAVGDVCTIALMNSSVIGSAFDSYTPSEKQDLVRTISLEAFAGCYVDCG